MLRTVSLTLGARKACAQASGSKLFQQLFNIGIIVIYYIVDLSTNPANGNDFSFKISCTSMVARYLVRNAMVVCCCEDLLPSYCSVPGASSTAQGLLQRSVKFIWFLCSLKSRLVPQGATVRYQKRNVLR